MNLGQNKILIGLGAALLIGSATFGYLLYQSSSDFEAADAKYNEQVAELKRLQGLPLYPEQANLKVLEDQKKAAQESAVSLHKQLLPLSFPIEPLTPEQFQDKLNASVKELQEKAAKAGVKLSDKFYLGFAQYRSTTPKPEAAAALGRQLKCIELVVDELIEKRVVSVGEITRDPLPEESDTAKVVPQTPGKAKPTPAGPVLLSKYPFKVEFATDQQAFQSVLNDLSKNDKQFLILRPLTIKNQSERAPKRVDPSADHVAETTDPSGAPIPSKEPPLRYVFGAEKLNVTLRVDSVVFASNLPK